jgi:hypothetical protein
VEFYGGSLHNAGMSPPDIRLFALGVISVCSAGLAAAILAGTLHDALGWSRAAIRTDALVGAAVLGFVCIAKFLSSRSG